MPRVSATNPFRLGIELGAAVAEFGRDDKALRIGVVAALGRWTGVVATAKAAVKPVANTGREAGIDLLELGVAGVRGAVCFTDTLDIDTGVEDFAETA